MGSPIFEEGGIDLPRLSNFIGTGEESAVADDAVPDEPFICLGWGLPKIRAVAKIHLHGLDGAAGAGDFAVDFHRDTFVGLNAEGEDIGVVLFPLLLKEDTGGVFEGDGDLGASLGQPFASAKIKGNSGPAPVIDEEAESDVGFYAGFGIDIGFLPIAVDWLTIDEAGAILAADDGVFKVVW